MVDDKGGLKVPEFTSADDLVHPNLAGYKVMEEIILNALN
jgi:lysophospholipase L1-like esterase